MRAGRYWMRSSRFLMMGARWSRCAAGAEVAQAVLHVRPGTLDRVEVGGVDCMRPEIKLDCTLWH